MAKTARTRNLTAVQDETLYADLREVESFAASLSESFLLCRELGHNWRPWTASRNAEFGGFDRVLRCNRCHTKRIQVLTNNGVVVKNQYQHPEGYLHKGMGRIVGDARGKLRLESITRTVNKIEARNAKRAS